MGSKHRSSYTIREFDKNIATQKEEATPTLLPTRFVDAEVINTETFSNVCLRNEMEIQSKMFDALLEKAEQVIRLLEVSDDTKCEPSHKSEVVDQLRADNDGKGNSSQEELRAYLRCAVAKDFHRVGFNCDVRWRTHSRPREKEDGRRKSKIETNYVMPKGNFVFQVYWGS
jgi:hypothetical protein